MAPKKKKRTKVAERAHEPSPQFEESLEPAKSMAPPAFQLRAAEDAKSESEGDIQMKSAESAGLNSMQSSPFQLKTSSPTSVLTAPSPQVNGDAFQFKKSADSESESQENSSFGSTGSFANPDFSTPPPSQFKVDNNNTSLGETTQSADSSPFQLKEDTGTAQKSEDSSGGDVMSKMSSTIGHDFSDVNIHTNSQQASNLGALAYTQGKDVHFAPGQYNPDSKGGQELLGHELTHVKQQAEGRVEANTAVNNMPVNNDSGLEKEADVMGAKAAQAKFDDSASIQKKSSGGASNNIVQAKFDLNAFAGEIDGALSGLKGGMNGEAGGPQVEAAPEAKVEGDKGGGGPEAKKEAAPEGPEGGEAEKKDEPADEAKSGETPETEEQAEGGGGADAGKESAPDAEAKDTSSGGDAKSAAPQAEGGGEGGAESKSGGAKGDSNPEMPVFDSKLEVGNNRIAGQKDPEADFGEPTLGRKAHKSEEVKPEKEEEGKETEGAEKKEEAQDSKEVTQDDHTLNLGGELTREAKHEDTLTDKQKEKEKNSEGSGGAGAGAGAGGEKGAAGGDPAAPEEKAPEVTPVTGNRDDEEKQQAEQAEEGGEQEEAAPEEKQPEAEESAEEAPEEGGGEEGEAKGEGGDDAAAEGDGEGGAEESGGEGGGGGAAAEGGDGGAAGGEGEGGAINGMAAEKKAPIPAAKGNFGAGSEPALVVVTGKHASSAPQESIVQDLGGGAFVIKKQNVAAELGNMGGAPPIQMQKPPEGDKDKTVPVPKDAAKAAFEANRAKVKEHIGNFETTATGEVNKVTDLNANIQSGINGAATVAKGVVLAGKLVQRARIEATFLMEKAKLLSESLRIKGEAKKLLDENKKKVTDAAKEQRKLAKEAFTTQNKALTTLETTMSGKVKDAFTDAVADMIDVAKEAGKTAKEKGRTKAAYYDAMETPSMGWRKKITHGWNYEKNRHDARVNASNDTAEGYAKEFMKVAEAEGEKLKSGGQAEILTYVKDSVKQAKEDIKARNKGAKEAIDKMEKGANDMLQANFDAKVAQGEGIFKAGIKSLTTAKTQQVTALNKTAEAQNKLIEGTAKALVTGLQEQVNTAHTNLLTKVNDTVSKVSGLNNPAAEAVKAKLDTIQGQVTKSVTDITTVINEGITGGQTSIGQMGGKAIEALTEVGTGAVEIAKQSREGSVTALEGLRDQFKTEAKTISEGAVGSIKTEGEEAVKDINKRYTDTEKGLQSTVDKLVAKFAENTAGLKANFDAQLAGLDAEIDKQAQKAYDAVKPLWKSVLLFVVDLVIAIIVTAIICAAFASGGILLALAVGVLAGAIGGALKYGARVALGTEEFSWGALGKEMALGAVSGVITALSAGAGSAAGDWLMARAGSGAFSWMSAKAGSYIGEVGVGFVFDTVGSGVTAVLGHAWDTGEWDLSKFNEAFTWQNLSINFLGNLGGKWLGDKLTGTTYPGASSLDDAASSAARGGTDLGGSSGGGGVDVPGNGLEIDAGGRAPDLDPPGGGLEVAGGGRTPEIDPPGGGGPDVDAGGSPDIDAGGGPRGPDVDGPGKGPDADGGGGNTSGPDGKGPDADGGGGNTSGPDGKGPDADGGGGNTSGPDGKGPDADGGGGNTSGPDGKGPDADGGGGSGNGPDGKGPDADGGGGSGNGPDGKGPDADGGGGSGNGPDGKGPDADGGGGSGNGPDGKGPDADGGGGSGNGPDGKGPDADGGGGSGNGPDGKGPDADGGGGSGNGPDGKGPDADGGGSGNGPDGKGPDGKGPDADPKAPDADVHAGEAIRVEKGYPEAPEGYQWVKKGENDAYIRRKAGEGPVNPDPFARKPQLRYDPESGNFFHADNPNMKFDPDSGKFIDPEGNKMYFNEESGKFLPDGGQYPPDQFREMTESFTPEQKAKLDTAEQFYKDNGVTGDLDSHLKGIDYNQPVEVVTLKSGEVYEQFSYLDRVTGEPRVGNYFAEIGADPTQLGIPVAGRVRVQVTLKEDVSFLKTATASIESWNGDGAVFGGGGIQYFSPAGKSAIGETKIVP